jgi:hypothetical protein
MKAKLLVGVALVAGAAAAAFAQDSGITKVRVRMHAVEKSGEHGTATLTSLGSERTQVDVSLKGFPKGVAQPAHIHEGNCKKLNPQPKWGLSNVVDGKSSTQVPVGLETLQAGNLAINVHKSPQDISTYFSCGSIPKAKAKKPAKK